MTTDFSTGHPYTAFVYKYDPNTKIIRPKFPLCTRAWNQLNSYITSGKHEDIQHVEMTYHFLHESNCSTHTMTYDGLMVTRSYIGGIHDDLKMMESLAISITKIELKFVSATTSTPIIHSYVGCPTVNGPKLSK